MSNSVSGVRWKWLPSLFPYIVGSTSSIHPLRSSAYIEIRCQRTMFVAKDEHEEAKIIPCPLPDCNHVWCKHCQQSIDVDGPKHSCDGTSELAHLVKQEGWKYCPSEPVPAYYVLSSQFLPLFQRARHLSRKYQDVITCRYVGVNWILLGPYYG
jgi:hypothetical protein